MKIQYVMPVAFGIVALGAFGAVDFIGRKSVGGAGYGVGDYVSEIASLIRPAAAAGETPVPGETDRTAAALAAGADGGAEGAAPAASSGSGSSAPAPAKAEPVKVDCANKQGFKRCTVGG